MSQILFHTPGQTVSIILETLDGYQRADSSVLPSVVRIIFPSLSLSAGYPQNMTKISTGLYIFNFTLPSLATSIGSYIVDVVWTDPATTNPAQTYYQIVVSAPFGRYTASSS